jgi:phage terminase small subunit
MGLTKRRQLFVTEYLANPKQPAAWAAVRAGFSEKQARETASELLKDPEIKAAIEHQLMKRLEKIEINEKNVLLDILAARERCIEAGAGAWQTTGRLKCDELLGKYLKMWVERVEVGLEEELIQRLTAGRKRAGLPAATEAK